MASQAIAHPHGHLLINHNHRLHLTVAGLTQDPGVDVRPVVKIHVIRQRMNPLPLQRHSGFIKLSQPFDKGTIRLGHSMTVQAFFNGRDSGLARFRGSGMAVQARNSKRARVQLV